jgi:tetratricopeptide (TPR) repeat protein
MNGDAEQDHRLMAAVAGALQQPIDERQSFLQAVCCNDPELYREAAETVEWEERMGNFLLEPLLIFKDFEKPFQPGDVISERFEIVREIGEGGMGVVYEAFDRKRNQRIAIKSAKTGFRRLLTPELESALKVRHPNICLVNEIHTAETKYGDVDFLTMELLDGESLASALLPGLKFSPKEALEIARQLCAGLSEAHRSGIIHRDLKSANVILCRSAEGNLRVVITDFGLSGATVTGSGELAGTPRYMAPELWRGEPASNASDIYALGVILYEVITGRPPFADDRYPSESQRPDPPSKWTKGLDRRWDAVVLSCLNPSPAARPHDAAQVLARLQKKRVRKAPLFALACLLVAASIPAVRDPVLQQFRPAKVRIAILPAEGSAETVALGQEVVQSVGQRITQFSSGGAKVAVVSTAVMLRKGVHTAGQAKEVSHATHVLQLTLHRDGQEIEAKASVIELSSQSHLREFTGHYSPQTVQDIPKALAGLVSFALQLHDDVGRDGISPAAKAAYDRGVYLLQTSNYDEALASFNEAVGIDPHSSWPLAGRAEAQTRKFLETKEQGYLEDAQQSLSQAQALGPDSAPVHLAAGFMSQINGQYAKALEDYQRAQEVDPRNIVALLRSAYIYRAQDMFDKAVENCRKAIRLKPDAPLPYQQLGALYYYHGEYALAAEQFRKALDRNPTLVEAYTTLGSALTHLGQDTEAEQAFLTSLSIRETPMALNNLGSMRAQQGRDADAADYFRRALTMAPGEYLDWLNLGDAERKLGHLNEARAAFHKGKKLALVELQKNPNSGQLRAVVAYLEARLGHEAAAAEEINEALQSAPGNSQIIEYAVRIYEAFGQRDRTIAVLKEAMPEQMQDLNQDRDLIALRQDPRFTQLMAKSRAPR